MIKTNYHDGKATTIQYVFVNCVNRGFGENKFALFISIFSFYL